MKNPHRTIINYPLNDFDTDIICKLLGVDPEATERLLITHNNVEITLIASPEPVTPAVTEPSVDGSV